jgi:hypothetical protein
MDIRWKIQELGKGGETNLRCAFVSLDGEPIHVTEGSRCVWTCGLQLLGNLRCKIAKDMGGIAAIYDEGSRQLLWEKAHCLGASLMTLIMGWVNL